MNPLTIGFIGLGVIGGSIAKGIRKIHPEYTLIAYSNHTPDLTLALSEDVIDIAADSVDAQFAACDIVFLCTPVTTNLSYLPVLKTILKPDCVITDVGSTKTEIHKRISSLHMDAQFIGGHPMAGSEKTGFPNSNDHLVENAWYVLTRTPAVSDEQFARMQTLVQDLNALPLALSYEEHDYIVAAVSHLPHLIASGLVNLVKKEDTPKGTMKQIAAGGFKDITRIASASPEMWQQICLANTDNILRILNAYIASLKDIAAALTDRDSAALYDLFADSREYRDSIPDTSAGPLMQEYSLYCDIIDEAGAIATIATLLATHQISIKNIGILHNREFEEGALKIEFYEASALESAANLLTRCQYRIFKRK